MSYKLIYFDQKGRGEAIRLIFAATGVKFTDDRVPPKYWSKVKPSKTLHGDNFPNWSLEEGIRPLPKVQLFAGLGRKFKLVGENEWEAAKCDEYVDAINDLLVEFIKILLEKDEVKKAEARQEFITTYSPKYLTRLNTLQYNNGGNYLVSKKMTWADIYISDKLQAFEETIDPGILNGYPHLRKVKDAVFSDPKIKDYVQRRL